MPEALTFRAPACSLPPIIRQSVCSMRCTRSGLNYVANYSSSAGEWRTCLRPSGQNSTKVLPAIRPKSPETILHRVSAGLVSLLGRHISESTLLPASATKRAYAGPRYPSLYRAVNVSLIAFRTRLPNGWPGNGSYRGSSPHIAPNPASIAFPEATPVSRSP